jgi:hypothetical protein
MAKWSEDHMTAIGSLKKLKPIFDRFWITWDRAGSLDEKWRPSVEKNGEWYMESCHLQVYSPRLCRLRTDRLAPRASIERTDRILIYGPSKPSSLSSTEAWLNPTTLLVGLGEKLGMYPLIGQLVYCGLCQEPFFSGAVESVQIYRWLVKGCYAWTTWDTYGRWPYVDWAWKVCGVLVGFSPAGCTSIRIVVTLEYEYRLFVAVIT